MLGQDNLTQILVAILSGAIPGFFALRQSHRTRKTVELAGSEVTVANWNKLIKNLYGEIDRLTTLNEQERKRAQARERELEDELDLTKARAAKEKEQLLSEIKELRQKLAELERRVSNTLQADTDHAVAHTERAADAQIENDERVNNGK